jgi:RNA 2',3'-cyclic 3'-phosphodiesterase
MIRAFVALPLPEAVTDLLQSIQADLPVGRLVPPENLHITLAFLGEHPGPVIEDVHYALAAIEAPIFVLRLAGLDLFGSKPRTVHAAIHPEPALNHLRARVLDAARSAGIEMPRTRYHPHATLARLGPALAPNDAQRLRDHVAHRSATPATSFAVEVFTLYRSHLGRSGAVYEAMAEYPLRSPSL